MLLALLGLHAALAVLAPAIARRSGRGVFLAGGLAPLAVVVYALVEAPGVMAGEALVETIAWAPALGLDATVRMDAFALLMVALVSGIGTLIFVYAYGYFSKPTEGLGRFAGALIAFAGSMLGLVLADNLLLLFVFWELTSITSYLLIGFENEKASARGAALQALLVTGGGGLALLGGLVLLGETAGTYSLEQLAATGVPAGGVTNAALVLVLLGCFTKSAHVPFHSWLPAAMAAPTPVSAYLHSATMVKAGVYLIARLSPTVAEIGPWRGAVVVVGAATMLLGAWRALRQHDLKLLLAFGTVSQLGFLTILFGLGTPKATFAGTALLLSHGLFKAALFMVTGIVDKKAGTRDLRRLTGLARAMPLTFVAAALGAASMVGLPPLLGFIAKEAAYEALLLGEFGALVVPALAVVVAASMVTFAYSGRFLHGAFAGGGPALEPQLEPIEPSAVRPPGAVFAAPALLLAALGMVFGILPTLVEGLVNAAAQSLDPGWVAARLELWHGLNTALGLSALVVIVGSGLFTARTHVERIQSRVPLLLDSKQAYDASVAGVLAGARRMTGIVQNGSLPIYLTVILATLLLLPGSQLIGLGRIEIGLPVTAGPMHAAVGLLVVLAALGAVASRRRFAAVIFLGAVGFGIGVLFVLQGAPDLALTQFLIETLAVVIFVLVLRHLPDRFRSAQLRAVRMVRAAMAVVVGLFVFVFTLVVGAVRTAPPISDEYVVRAVPEAHGRNVVNVILVDFRALDTLGEIVVLAVAAMGIASLVLAARLDARRSSYPAEGDEQSAQEARR